MSLQDIRSECSDTAALLQPYVDGELAVAEQERVACHLEDCRPCRSAVAEQQWVRATLRAVWLLTLCAHLGPWHAHFDHPLVTRMNEAESITVSQPQTELTSQHAA